MFQVHPEHVPGVPQLCPSAPKSSQPRSRPRPQCHWCLGPPRGVRAPSTHLHNPDTKPLHAHVCRVHVTTCVTCGRAGLPPCSLTSVEPPCSPAPGILCFSTAFPSPPSFLSPGRTSPPRVSSCPHKSPARAEMVALKKDLFCANFNKCHWNNTGNDPENAGAERRERNGSQGGKRGKCWDLRLPNNAFK